LTRIYPETVTGCLTVIAGELLTVAAVYALPSDTLVVAPTNRSTLGDRAFPVAASRAWNGLPSSVRAASSLSTFRSSFQWLTCTSAGRLSFSHCLLLRLLVGIVGYSVLFLAASL